MDFCRTEHAADGPGPQSRLGKPTLSSTSSDAGFTTAHFLLPDDLRGRKEKKKKQVS